MRGGRKLKAVIPGRLLGAGAAGRDSSWTARWTTTRCARRAARVGTGAVIVMDETTCMVRVLERISRFYMAESCGQCTPCREGTGWLTRMLRRILAGQGQDVGPRPAGAGREPDRGAHDLRARRRRGLAGAELPAAISATSSTTWSSTAARASSMRPRRRWHERRPRQRRGRRPAAEGAQGPDDHPADRPGRRLRAALLLPREAARSPPTAACAWSRSRRRRSRCRPARRRSPRA